MLENRKREIRKKADSLRGECKVGRYGIIDLFRECEHLGYMLLRYPLDENADLGLVLKKDDDTIIFINSNNRLSRQIFTLAHEIGHIVLHFSEDQSFIDNQMTITGKEDKEQEANYFAACLLMPAEEVQRFIDLELPDYKENGLTALDIARMMSEFSVSYEMTLNRLESLNIINENQKNRLDTERVERSVGELLRSIGGNAGLNNVGKETVLPHEFIEYAIYNYNNNAIPEETLEKVLGYYQLSREEISDRLMPKTEPEIDLDELIGGLED